jgi:hypothetical protein
MDSANKMRLVGISSTLCYLHGFLSADKEGNAYALKEIEKSHKDVWTILFPDDEYKCPWEVT